MAEEMTIVLSIVLEVFKIKLNGRNHISKAFNRERFYIRVGIFLIEYSERG